MLPVHLVVLSLLSAGLPQASASEPSPTTTQPPECTISAKAVGGGGGGGAFFDLRPDIAIAKEDGKPHPYKGVATSDYKVNGWDYKHNFTLNICAGTVKTVEDVVGVKSNLWKNVSAYYEKDDRIYSLGQESVKLVSRGRKLVLQYQEGSPCGTSSSSSQSSKRSSVPVHSKASYKSHDDDAEESSYNSAGDQKRPGEDDHDAGARRKSTTISFLCDHDPANDKAAVAFVGTDPDECAYFFEVRSRHACISAEPRQPGGVGPGGVFALIFGIALVVYFAGGVFYQRTVAHARGWRQLPNYSLWHGIWSFVTDLLVILTASCLRFLPSRRGYGRLAVSPSGRGRDDENRLIDQLDEEWDD